jgi:hypothetical protein
MEKKSVKTSVNVDNIGPRTHATSLPCPHLRHASVEESLQKKTKLQNEYLQEE